MINGKIRSNRRLHAAAVCAKGRLKTGFHFIKAAFSDGLLPVRHRA
ncbi:hypothetical protein HMPREF9123_0551 [Neisseria bacilliformis ATCC BAA-1200]|uniref:Uncharacterized protein n=1 Tax=Neisseria bacilliformis ATCC BAA-1200 TaxID=888742 RepID=F2BA24_9NEIS|nr:hypothetical protein HMPREF9123_0551 [Neisseria bacilliformis ATCC BAA-1200]